MKQVGWPASLIALACAAGSAPVHAAAPAISIIIDDMGQQEAGGRRALALPGDVAYSFLPGTRLVAAEAGAAHREGREVLLHLPMQPFKGGYYPMGLRRSDDRSELDRRFEQAIATVPYVSGVNNHEGSLLTADRPHMEWLMKAIRRHGGLYFVDSRTTARSVAYRTARAFGVPATSRQVFLDDVQDPQAILIQWRRLLAIARHRGTALAIGHPHPHTLAVLERVLPQLAAQGIRIVPPSALIRLQGNDAPERVPPRLRLIMTLAGATTATAR